MGTKVIIIGQKEKETEKKKIEFVKMVRSKTMCIEDFYTKPEGWKYIELVCLDYGYDGIDLMFAHDGIRSEGTLYLGRFNDGVV